LTGNTKPETQESQPVQEFAEQEVIGKYLSFIKANFENIANLLEPLIFTIKQIAKNYEFSKNKIIPDIAIQEFLISLTQNQESSIEKISLAQRVRDFLDLQNYNSYKPEIEAPKNDEEINSFLGKISQSSKQNSVGHISPVAKIKAWDDLQTLVKTQDSSEIKLPNQEELTTFILHEILTQIFNETFSFDAAEDFLIQKYEEIETYAKTNNSQIAKNIITQINEILGSLGNKSGITFLNKRFIDHQKFLNLKRKQIGQQIPIIHPTVKQLYTWWLAGDLSTSDKKTARILDTSECGTGKTITMIGLVHYSQNPVNLIVV
jgi:hypothetical protein